MPKSQELSPSAIKDAQVLARYKACHACRRKKLKCDAQEPCGPCIRSQTHAVKYRGADPKEPIPCTYDDPEDLFDGGRYKIKQLETKIAELEEALREKDEKLALCTCGASGNESSGEPVETIATVSSTISVSTEEPANLFFGPEEALVAMDTFASDITINNPLPSRGMDQAAPMFGDTFDKIPSPMADWKIWNLMWPLNLPPPDVVHHLVEVFFTSVPLASRLIHQPTFQACLQKPVTSRDFPQVSLLHAICGFASFYTPLIKDNLPDGDRGAGPTKTFHSGIMAPVRGGRFKPGPRYVPLKFQDIAGDAALSFGATQIRWAATTAKFATYHGDRLPQVVQAGIICVWYNYTMGIHLNLYTWLSWVYRTLTPLGWNVGKGYEPLSRLPPQMYLLMPEPWPQPFHELPRNLFWMSFCMERIYMATNTWPLAADEQDVTQIMPCTQSDFQSLRVVSREGRQTLTSPDYFTYHPPQYTDSFSLYIKGAILLGRVKTFNARFHRHHDSKLGQTATYLDPRRSAEFQELEASIVGLIGSTPKELADPTNEKRDGKVDPVLYLAHLLPHTAMILLHDPHAKLAFPQCASTAQITTAVQAILALIYKICSTSFDLVHLDHGSSLCWFVAGAALIRMIKARMEVGDVEEASRMQQELQVIRFMLGTLGKKVVIGLRQLNLLDDLYSAELGGGNDVPAWIQVKADVVADIMLPD